MAWIFDEEVLELDEVGGPAGSDSDRLIHIRHPLQLGTQDDPTDLLQYYNDRCFGEKALLAATLYDAIVILSRPKQRSEDGKERFRETMDWFKSNSTAPFSFFWICTYLQIDPVKILAKIFDPEFYKHPRRRRSPNKQKPSS